TTDTPSAHTYTLSLHDALPICPEPAQIRPLRCKIVRPNASMSRPHRIIGFAEPPIVHSAPRSHLDGIERQNLPDHRRHQGHRSRSEEHTSELQSLAYLVCRLLL